VEVVEVTRGERTPDAGRAGGDRRASDVARARLGADLSSEMAATRAAWADALLRSDAALRHGRPEEARRALDDQRLLLVQLQRRLDRAVSSALVEREAEHALQGGEQGLEALAAGPRPGDREASVASGEPVPGEAGAFEAAAYADRRGGLRRIPRALSGAAAAAIVGVVAMLLGSAPPPTPEIAAMDQVVPADERPTEALELRITAEPDLSPPPADELRSLSSWTPAPAAEPDPEPAEPAPQAELREAPAAPEGDDATTGDADDGSERAGAREAAERGDGAGDDERDARETTERGDEADEADGESEELVARLPRIDRPLSPRLDEHLGGLLEP
jgi:hypothetical protein